MTQAWALAGRKPLLDKLTAVTIVTPADIVAGLQSNLTKPAVLTDGGAGAGLDGAAKSLKTLATPPTGKDQLTEVIETATAINTDLAALKTKAASASTAKAASDALPTTAKPPG